MARTTAPEIQARSVWSLFNSFNEARKETSLGELSKRFEALYGLRLTGGGDEADTEESTDRMMRAINTLQEVCPEVPLEKLGEQLAAVRGLLRFGGDWHISTPPRRGSAKELALPGLGRP